MDFDILLILAGVMSLIVFLFFFPGQYAKDPAQVILFLKKIVKN